MRNRKKGQSCLFIISGKKGQLTARSDRVIFVYYKRQKTMRNSKKGQSYLFIISGKKPREIARRDKGIYLL